MSTKVLLIYPQPSLTSPQKSPPLSILYVGEALKMAKMMGLSDENYQVRYFDDRYECKPDLDWPDVVGVSSMTGYQLKGAIRWLKRAHHKGKRTILGGIHATMQPEQCLAEPYIDSVVVGPGEWAVLDAIGGVQIAQRPLDGRHVSPVSQHTLIHFKRSAASGDTILLTSRGCPFRCGFCLDGDTNIMLSDLSWRKLRDIQVGDNLVGLSKSSYGFRLTPASVTAKQTRVADAFEIHTDLGHVISSGDHKWLSLKSRWRPTKNLRPGDRIRWIATPVDKVTDTDDYKKGYLGGSTAGLENQEIANLEFARGYIAGYYDADGSCDQKTVRFWGKDAELLHKVGDLLGQFGFFVRSETNSLRILGGLSEKIRFFSIFQPKVAHKCPVFDVSAGKSFAKVLSITPCGRRELFDLTTTTENFIANGLVSHNCYNQKFSHRHWESVDLERWRYDVLYLKELAGVNKLEHGDDWIGKWDRARQIIRWLKEAGIQYRPSLRANQINDEVAQEMAELGVRHVSVGMETASKRMLALTQKDITNLDQITCAWSLAEAGVWPLYYWIVGFPTESKQDTVDTLDAMDKMAEIHAGRLTQNIYAYTAIPGSPLYEIVDKSKLPQNIAAWSDYSLNHTDNELANNLYHIGGLHFHKGAGEKTDRNFPGWRRMLIKPFEVSADLRWRWRYFSHYRLERQMLEWVLEKWAFRSSHPRDPG